MVFNIKCGYAPLVWFATAFAAFSVTETTLAANWAVTDRNDFALETAGAGFAVGEMSGVTYIGTSPETGKHRFVAVQDSSADLVIFDTAFSLAGDLLQAQVVGRRTLGNSFDFEGIVAADDTVFVSEENGPGVREYSFSDGSELQSVAIPSVFTNNSRGNKGFESLARNDAGTKMWTANEEALTIDGPTASPTQETIVRILEFDVNGSSLTAASQFAYAVDPVHDSGLSNARGLSELVALPDGTLLALERSFAAFASPTWFGSIYEISTDESTTDVSQGLFDTGLDGETIIRAGKEELWSGEVGATGGENLEGLALGPRLPNGNWILLGVVDDGDLFSSNTIVAFELENLGTAIPIAPDTGDFNQDADVDGTDFLAWQRGVGVATLAGLNDGDGNHSGTVTSADLMIWENQYGTVPPQGFTQTIPEPLSLALLFSAGLCSLAIRRRR